MIYGFENDSCEKVKNTGEKSEGGFNHYVKKILDC